VPHIEQNLEKKIAIIANRRAGQSSVLQHVLQARSNLWGRPSEFLFPDSVADLQKLITQINVENQHEAIVLIGGDGTVNQAIRGLGGQPNSVPLYVYPGGTANDLAKELRIKPDWTQVQALVDRRSTWMMDLILVNEVPFSTVAGVGVGASLTTEFNERRHSSFLFQTVARMAHAQIYTLLTAKTVLFSRDYIHHLHIRSSSYEEKLRTPAVFVCNQSKLGGDISVAPDISNDDNRFNVLIVRTCSRTKLLKAMADLKSGKLSNDFVVFSTDRLTLTDLNGRKIHAFGDGESLAHSSRLEFTIIPKVLKIFRDPRERIRI
jgi:diacylglycerol kinase (ATP)